MNQIRPIERAKRMTVRLGLLFMCSLVCLSWSAAFGAEFERIGSVTAPGGVHTSGEVQLTSTIGQAGSGFHSGGEFSLVTGFSGGSSPAFFLADLAVTQKTNPQLIVSGSNLVYTVAVTNKGPALASGIVLNNQLPAEVLFDGFIQGAGVHEAGVILYNLPDLQPQSSLAVSFRVRTGPVGNITNRASVTATQSDPAPANNHSAKITRVISPDPVIVGQPMSVEEVLGEDALFTVMVEGAGPFQYQWRLNGEVIRGATNAFYYVPFVHPTNSGNYRVLIQNRSGVAASDQAELSVTLPQLMPGDDFVDRVALPGDMGRIRGSNDGFTRQSPTEPYHADRPGRSSGWFTWTPTSSGIARFETVGSGFDTLLAIYSGGSLGGLVEVTSDDDRGAFHTSKVIFNAVAGTTYIVAIDGFSYYSGNFILTWEMEVTPETLPVITAQPTNMTVLPGSDALFTVSATGPGLTYRWFRNGDDIAGAFGPALFIPSVNRNDLGVYWVWITNSFGRVMRSRPVELQLGPVSTFKVEDKVGIFSLQLQFGLGGGVEGEAALFDGFGGGDGVGGSSPGLSFATPLTMRSGVPHSQTWNNFGSTTSSGEIGCSKVWSANTTFFFFEPDEDGCVDFDTSASDVIPSIALIWTEGSDDFCEFVSTNTSFSMPVKAGVVYYAQLDGAGQVGDIQLDLTLNALPTNLVARSELMVIENGEFTLSALSTNTTELFDYRWYLDGSELSGETNFDLTVTGVSLSDAGEYLVVVGQSNQVCSFHSVAEVEVVSGDMYLLSTLGQSTGLPEIELTVLATTSYVIQASEDLTNWVDVWTNRAPQAVLESSGGVPSRSADYTESIGVLYDLRYFQAQSWGP